MESAPSPRFLMGGTCKERGPRDRKQVPARPWRPTADEVTLMENDLVKDRGHQGVRFDPGGG